MARATKNAISGGPVWSEPRMTGLSRRRRLDAAQGRARWPMQRDRGQCSSKSSGAVVNRMRAMRKPGEIHSQVMFRLVDNQAAESKMDRADD
jgi:hypothetical protein